MSVQFKSIFFAAKFLRTPVVVNAPTYVQYSGALQDESNSFCEYGCLAKFLSCEKWFHEWIIFILRGIGLAKKKSREAWP